MAVILFTMPWQGLPGRIRITQCFGVTGVLSLTDGRSRPAFRRR
jgi:hypothetical protein